MSLASDYVRGFLHQRTDNTDIGMTLAVVQHSAAASISGVSGFASSPTSTPQFQIGRPDTLVGLAFDRCPLYFSDRRSRGSGPFSGPPDTVDVVIGIGGHFGFPDGLAHLSIANESWGGRMSLSTTSVDAQSRQLLFEGPGAGNVGFSAMFIMSLFPSPIPG